MIYVFNFQLFLNTPPQYNFNTSFYTDTEGGAFFRYLCTLHNIFLNLTINNSRFGFLYFRDLKNFAYRK